MKLMIRLFTIGWLALGVSFVLGLNELALVEVADGRSCWYENEYCTNNWIFRDYCEAQTNPSTQSSCNRCTCGYPPTGEEHQ